MEMQPRWRGGAFFQNAKDLLKKILTPKLIYVPVLFAIGCLGAIVVAAVTFLPTDGASIQLVGQVCESITKLFGNADDRSEEQRGGAIEYVHILGKRRKVVREGRYKMITYQGQKMCLTEARKLENKQK
jgi:hypothetical protein